jgi:hypothetical protein
MFSEFQVFPKGSPLVADVLESVLNVKESRMLGSARKAVVQTPAPRFQLIAIVSSVFGDYF